MTSPSPLPSDAWRDARIDMPYDEFFAKGSVLGLAKRGEPYSFRETYELMRRIYGYELHYVNYGLWLDGRETVEPAREMTLRLGELLGLQKGQRLLEAGSGLGQAAVDMAHAFQLDKVKGLNINKSQVAFANELARRSGLGDVVHHHHGDACVFPEQQEHGAYHHAHAQECIGHFPDPARFLEGVRKMLPPGGRFACTVVTCPRSPPKAFTMIVKQAFHAEPRTADHWKGMLETAGFKMVAHDDLAEPVFGRMFEHIDHQMRENPEALGFARMPIRKVFERLLAGTRSGVEAGWLGYDMLVGEVPA